MRVTQTPECPKVDPDLLSKEREDKKKAQLQGLEALTCGVPRWNTGVFSILEGIMGRRGGGARAWVPRRPQLLLSHSRSLAGRDSTVAGCGRVAQSHGRSSRRPSSPPCVQSFLLLSPLLNEPQHASRSRDRKTETAWTVLAAVATLPLTPSPASTSVLHIRSETLYTCPNTRQTRAAAIANQSGPGVQHPPKG